MIIYEKIKTAGKTITFGFALAMIGVGTWTTLDFVKDVVFLNEKPKIEYTLKISYNHDSESIHARLPSSVLIIRDEFSNGRPDWGKQKTLWQANVNFIYDNPKTPSWVIKWRHPDLEKLLGGNLYLDIEGRPECNCN